MLSDQLIIKAISIDAPVSAVWEALTNNGLIKQWMAEPEMEIEVITDWKVESPIVIKGFHHIEFENRGSVLQFEPDKVLRYSYLNSLSRLPDLPENYVILEFRLTPKGNQTTLELTISNFATETIYQHTDFYWKTTIEIVKKFVEAR